MKNPIRSLVALLGVSLFAGLASAQTAPTDAPSPTAPVPAGAMPAIPKLNPKLPTLWIVGDSTVKNGSKDQVGWGDPLAKMFDASKINVVNRARGGRSSRTYQTEGLWDDVLKNIKQGDFVLIQFGHNDGGPLSGDNRERGSIRGVGEETKDVELTLGDNKGKKYTVHTFGWYMKQYVADARAKGATPIICSWVPHAPKGPVNADAAPASYQLLAQQVAEETKAPYLDLFKTITQTYTTMTPDEVRAKWFAPDGTHSTPAGAAHNAEVVAKDLGMLKDVKLAEFLTDEAKAKIAK